ncbi:MAG TPA: hypothetical protein VMF69_21230 [Gemmataceae bacterium]|nr:hypothetical protein [Gemmataceae bacterium]
MRTCFFSRVFFFCFSVFLLCVLRDSVVCLSSPADESKTAGFTFPEDAGGLLLAKVLLPKDAETMQQKRTQPPQRSPSSVFLNPPTLPLPPSRAALPHWPDERKRAPLRPRLIDDETLVVLAAAPPLPQAPALPDKGRIRVPSPDVNQPIPLPSLAQQASNRASLDDPTMSVSTAAALAAPIPLRTNKAPFLKRTLPDPYDHRRLEMPVPEESKDFPVGSPQLPRR